MSTLDTSILKCSDISLRQCRSKEIILNIATEQEAMMIEALWKVDPFVSDKGSGGFVDIKCASEIIITVDGGINADDAGLDSQIDSIIYEKYVAKMRNFESSQQNVFKKGINKRITMKKKRRNERGKKMEKSDKSKTIVKNDRKRILMLTFGAGSSIKESVESDKKGKGGGIIALRSATDIVTYGMLTSNGSAVSGYTGGEICLCARGNMINRGRIESRPRGRIIIQCRRFVNEGFILPGPDVLIITKFKIISF